jgi:hypothetical protein
VKPGGLALLLLPLALTAQAQMYKCQDARGVTQYADKPCPGGKGKEVDIRGQPPISGKLTPYRENLGSSEREFRYREAQRERERQNDARALQVRQQRCNNLQMELQRLSATRRPPDAAQHDARIAGVNAEMSRTCQ